MVLAAAVAISLFLLGGTKPDLTTLLTSVIATAIVLAVGWSWVVSAWKRTYAAAWIARFKNGGEFVRIWDYHDLQPDTRALEELFQLSVSGR